MVAARDASVTESAELCAVVARLTAEAGNRDQTGPVVDGAAIAALRADVARLTAERDQSRADTTNAVRAREVAERERCLLYTSPSPRDRTRSRMPSSA